MSTGQSTAAEATETEDLRQAVAGRSPGRFGWLRRRRRWVFGCIAFALLAQMAFVMVTTAVEQTPTIDEPVYIGTSVVYLDQHSLRYNSEHPPLGKLIVAAGVAFTHPRLDPSFSGQEWELGPQVLYKSGNDPAQLLLAARLPMIVLTLLFGLVVFAFATELAGAAGGLLALALYAFSPDLIANGSLATFDVPMAGFLLTAAWLVWRARRRPALYLPLAGLALGAAIATKMTALAAVPVVMALAVVSVWHARRVPDRKQTARLLGTGVVWAVGVALIAVAVVWASYLVVDPGLRWETPPDVHAVSGLRRLADALPFPKPYLDGMRFQFLLEEREWGGFLFGRHYSGALWYFLPVALLVKTPLGALALWLAGAVVMLAVPRLRPAAPYVLIVAFALMAAGMPSVRNIGVRYVVSLPMFLAVAAAGVVLLRRWWVNVAAVALVAFAAVSSLRTFPYYLPYSNEAFGGPAETHLSLSDSNVDWGQDLGRLADRLKQHYAGQRIWLVYQGSGLPSYYGIDAGDPLTAPPDQVHGLLVVSDSMAVTTGEGGEDGEDLSRLPGLIAAATPIDEVGHSITIYRLP